METSYLKAGQIAAEALEFGKKLIKEGVTLLSVANQVENKIFQLGGKPAFPVQISKNEIAAHFCPMDEVEIFENGDVAKLDVGVHINGFIADTACSVAVGMGNLELIKASNDALNDAIQRMTPGTTLGEIGAGIQEIINAYGFNPIKNLSGHQIKQYELHAGLSIPNFKNNSSVELEEGQVFAIEPFATTGEGFVKDGKPSGVYSIIEIKPTRAGREIFDFIKREYNHLPFTSRWLLKRFPEFKVSSSFRFLEREGVVKQYPQLPERSNGIVSQAEHTVIVKRKPLIITKLI